MLLVYRQSQIRLPSLFFSTAATKPDLPCSAGKQLIIISPYRALHYFVSFPEVICPVYWNSA